MIVFALAVLGSHWLDCDLDREGRVGRTSLTNRQLWDGMTGFGWVTNQSLAGERLSPIHCTIVPSSELFNTAQFLLCCRQYRYFLKPTSRRSLRHVFVAALLLIAGIERNPGPSNTPALKMGLINARSMVNKSALIHDVINDNRLDLLAVTETWVYENSPDVHKREAAPPAYSVVHVHRAALTGRKQKVSK